MGTVKTILVFLIVVYLVVAMPISLLVGINLMFGDIVDYTLKTWFGALIIIAALQLFLRN